MTYWEVLARRDLMRSIALGRDYWAIDPAEIRELVRLRFIAVTSRDRRIKVKLTKLGALKLTALTEAFPRDQDVISD